METLRKEFVRLALEARVEPGLLATVDPCANCGTWEPRVTIEHHITPTQSLPLLECPVCLDHTAIPCAEEPTDEEEVCDSACVVDEMGCEPDSGC